MANPEHLILKKETTWGTSVTPDKAIPVNNLKYSPGRERIEGRYTGASRGAYGRWPGAKKVTGSIDLPLWGDYLGLFFAALQLGLITPSTPAGATTAKMNTFLPDDAAALIGLSGQAQWSASQAVNFLGMVFDKMTVSAKVGEAASMSVDFLAKDEAPAGVNWDYVGATASPAQVATPAYFARTIRPFIFTEATLTTGGTVAVDGTSKEMTISGGTAQTKVDNIEITLENGAEARFGVGDPTPHSISLGDRTVAIKFDKDLTTVDRNFYDEYRNGSQVAAQLSFLGPQIEVGHYRKCVITLPLVDFENADWPEISGSKGSKVRTVNAVGIVDPDLGYDIGVTLIDTQAGY